MNEAPTIAQERRPGWRKRLFQQTPRLVTLAGYLFGLGILAAAGSTWFMRTDLFSQGTATLRPTVNVIRAERETVVMDDRHKPGDSIGQGEELARVLEDPESVANWRLAADLRERIHDYERLATPSAAARREELSRMLTAIAATQTERPLTAPEPGWLISPEGAPVASDPPSNATAQGRIVPPGGTIAGIANPEALKLEVVVACDHFPTIQPGDRVSILLADWDTRDAFGRVSQIQTTLSAEIPRSEFSDEQMNKIKTARPLKVRLGDDEMPAEATVGKETIRLSLAGKELPAPLAGVIKTGKPFTLGFPANEEKKVRIQWDSIQAKVTLELPDKAISPLVRQALAEQLSRGNAALTVSRCWIKVGTQRLFLRLFGK